LLKDFNNLLIFLSFQIILSCLKSILLSYIKAFSDIILVSLFTAICVMMNIEILKQFTKK